MIGLSLKLLLGGWSRLLSALTAAWGWATKNPVAALCVVLAGLTVWFWHSGNVKQRKIEAQAAQIATILKASAENALLALEQKRAWEAKSASIAKEAQEDYETDLAQAGNDTRRYIAANRVRPAQVCRSNAPAAGESQGASVPAPMPADTFVAISEPDLQACSASAAYAVGAHNAAMDQIAAGLAEP